MIDKQYLEDNFCSLYFCDDGGIVLVGGVVFDVTAEWAPLILDPPAHDHRLRFGGGHHDLDGRTTPILLARQPHQHHRPPRINGLPPLQSHPAQR